MQLDLGGEATGRPDKARDEFIAARLAESPAGEDRHWDKIKSALLEGRLRPWHSKYLGFRITRFMGKTRTGIHAESILRLRRKVRELTARDRGRSLEAVIGELNSLLRGWGGYFRPGLCETLAGTLDHWIRRRLRAYVWTQWKLPRTRVNNLVERGTARR